MSCKKLQSNYKIAFYKVLPSTEKALDKVEENMFYMK